MNNYKTLPLYILVTVLIFLLSPILFVAIISIFKLLQSHILLSFRNNVYVVLFPPIRIGCSSLFPVLEQERVAVYLRTGNSGEMESGCCHSKFSMFWSLMNCTLKLRGFVGGPML